MSKSFLKSINQSVYPSLARMYSIDQKATDICYKSKCTFELPIKQRIIRKYQFEKT